MKKPIIYFLSGGFLALLIAASLYFGWGRHSAANTQSDYYIITNQIKKMNKMVVMEQDFSAMQKTKITSEMLGGILPSSEKEIVTFTKTNAQVSYNLDKMKLEVDSINKKIIIKELPAPEVRILPSVEITSLDDSFLNRFNETDIKKITAVAKQNAVATVDKAKLQAAGKKQLIENLRGIFVLAKALHYEIEDQISQIDTSKF